MGIIVTSPDPKQGRIRVRSLFSYKLNPIGVGVSCTPNLIEIGFHCTLNSKRIGRGYASEVGRGLVLTQLRVGRRGVLAQFRVGRQRTPAQYKIGCGEIII